MKKFLLLVSFVWVSLFTHAQFGHTVQFDLGEISVYESVQNVHFADNLLIRAKSRKDAYVVFNPISINVESLQPFVAVTPVFPHKITSQQATLLVRTRENEIWSEWSQVPADEHAPAGTFAGEQMYFNTSVEAVQYKLNLHVGQLSIGHMFSVRVYQPGVTPALNFTLPEGRPKSGSDCDCDIPAYLDRLGWCPIPFNCPQNSNPTITDVTHLIVHHSAGTNSSSDWAAVVRAIWDFHVNTNGWADIGYNYLIDPNGVIYEGRGDNVSGAHFSCMNARTMGVCLLGNFQTATPTQAMLNSLTELLGWKVCDIEADPTAAETFSGSGTVLNIISGHRDGNGIPNSCTTTACPGDNMYPLLPGVRNSVAGYIEECELQPEPQNSDIVVISMQSNPQSPVAGEVAQLQVRLRNIGAANITQPFSTSFRIAGAEVGTQTTNSLNAGSSVDLSVNYIFAASGTYQYCVFAEGAHNEVNTANNSFCVNVTVQPVQEQPNNIHDIRLSEIVVFPNPAADYLNIQSEFVPDRIWMVNTVGQVVADVPGNREAVISVNHLPAGVYILKLQFEQGVAERKVIVE
jgi:hypothetical protein